MSLLEIELRKRILECTKCEMRDRRCFPLEGIAPAAVMVIGQGPHPNRVPGQKHFSGKASRYFQYFLDELGLSRESICITNVIKCIDGRFEGSGEKCVSFLKEEIDLVNPKEIFVLGARATRAILGATHSYGHFFYRGKHYYILPHPATCLRGLDEERSQKIKLYYDTIASIKRLRTTLLKENNQVTLDRYA